MIAHCDPIESYQGNYLSGWVPYQAIENYHYVSMETYDISCGAPAPGYSLSGDVPPGLVCETPGATATRLIAPVIGDLFSEHDVLGDVVKTYDLKTMTFNIGGSDQGTFSVIPQQSATIVTKTFNFTLEYTGIDDAGAPCATSLGLTLIVLINFANQLPKALIEIDKRIK